MAIVTYNDNGTIKVVKFGTRVVSTDADPVVQKQKQWVFLKGTIDVTGMETHSAIGIPDPGYTSQGCASPLGLRPFLNLNYPVSDYNIGARVAIRMNGGTGDTCGTWALFEVQEV